MKIRILIDGIPCDTDTRPAIALDYDASALAVPDSGRTGRSLRLELPATPENRALLGWPSDLHAAAPFNLAPHRGAVYADDALLLEGPVSLRATALGAPGDRYRIEIREGGAAWAETAARTMFNAFPIEYRAYLTPTTVWQSWTDDKPVKFFPVKRDAYPVTNSSVGLQPALRILSPDDYHPFLAVAALVGSLFAAEGYTLKSRFAESAFFRSLYMSGAYPSKDMAGMRRHMDFLARRRTEATAEADAQGRVYASPYMSAHSVGNLVETAHAGDPDPEGNPMTELFNHGNCFRIEQGQILFRPPVEVSVGFRYRLRYVTDYRIRSRQWLEGFDSVYLGDGIDAPGRLLNRFADRRGALQSGRQYRAVVFDHIDGTQYRATCSAGGTPGLPIAAFSTRSALVTTPAQEGIRDPVLQYRRGAMTQYADYPGDWALYDGYIGETGRTEVETTLRTPPVRVTPTSPKTFSTIYFYGAGEGMGLSLDASCSLQPCFSGAPGLGSPLQFADVAQHRIRQSVLLEALCHLFNLRIHTEQRTRTVRMEPEEEFYDRTKTFDWTERIDPAGSVEITDLACGVHQTRTLGYLDDDGVVTRGNDTLASPLGDWSAENESYATIPGEEELRSPLFSPTLSRSGDLAEAPSALVMQVSDRDREELPEACEFSPRIVRYCGMHPLPEGERWGYPSGEARYPLAAFHFAGDAATEGFTLCFEDRDGQRGLHRYYDAQFGRERLRQRITLWLRLAPHQIEQLFLCDGPTPDIRSVFLFRIGGERVRCILSKIHGYDPAAAAVRCSFDRLAED